MAQAMNRSVLGVMMGGFGTGDSGPAAGPAAGPGVSIRSISAEDAATAKLMNERLPLLTPDEEEDLFREAGFSGVALFYAAFSFRGWVGTA